MARHYAKVLGWGTGLLCLLQIDATILFQSDDSVPYWVGLLRVIVIVTTVVGAVEVVRACAAIIELDRLKRARDRKSASKH